MNRNRECDGQTGVGQARGRPLAGGAAWPAPADVVMALVVAFALYRDGQGLFGSDDLGWHLVVGRRVLATLSVPRVDWLTFTHAGQPFMAWEWLWDAAGALLESVAGLWGLLWATALLAGLTFRLVARDLARRDGSPVLGAALALVAARAGWVHAFVRPHMVSWLFTWVTWRAIAQDAPESEDRAATGAHCASAGACDSTARGAGSTRTAIGLTCMYVLWANVHPGFLLGLALVTARAAGLWLDGRREQALAVGRLALLLGLASLANPWGPWLHWHAVAAGAGGANARTVEFLPPDLFGPGRDFGLLLAFSLASLALPGWRPAAADWLPAAAFTALALRSARVIPLAAMLLASLASPPLSAMLARAVTAPGRALRRCDTWMQGASAAPGAWIWPGLLALGATLALCPLAGRLRPAVGFSPLTYPVEAASALLARPPGRVFCEAVWAGYLDWRQPAGARAPDYPCFIDNRFDMHGAGRIEEFLSIEGAHGGWQATLDGYAVRYILVNTAAPLAGALPGAGWRIVFRDTHAVLAERTALAP